MLLSKGVVGNERGRRLRGEGDPACCLANSWWVLLSRPSSLVPVWWRRHFLGGSCDERAATWQRAPRPGPAPAAGGRRADLRRIEALLGAQGQQRLAQRHGPGVGGPVATVAAEVVAELGAEGAEGPLERVGHGALVGRLVALGALLRHHPEPHVGARRHARHVQPDGGGVGGGVLDRTGLGIAGGELPRGDLADEVVAPAAVAEQAVGLRDGDAAGEIGEGVPGAAFALGDETGVQWVRPAAARLVGARPGAW